MITAKVKKVTRVKRYEKVYDIETKNHNFYANDILVHNCHKTSDYAVSNKIMPMLGSYKHYQLIKIGVALFKNNFFKSFQDEKFMKCIANWVNCQRLKESGIVIHKGIEYPKYVCEIMPWEKKVEYFGEKAIHLGKGGSISLMDFITQYELTWLENIEAFLTEKQQNQLASGSHKELKENDGSGVFVFGLDTAAGSIVTDTLEGDYTNLAIWCLRAGRAEKVASYEWQGHPLEQFEDIKNILTKFKTSYGLIDYSNIGINFVHQLQRLGIQCDGLMYSSSDQESHKNVKIAMFEHFQNLVALDKAKYPKIFDKDGKTLVSDQMYKDYIEWTIFERHARPSGRPLLTAPSGSHDDAVNADALALWGAKKSNSGYAQSNEGFVFSGGNFGFCK